jgi:hypothetical protein
VLFKIANLIVTFVGSKTKEGGETQEPDHIMRGVWLLHQSAPAKQRIVVQPKITWRETSVSCRCRHDCRHPSDCCICLLSAPVKARNKRLRWKMWTDFGRARGQAGGRRRQHVSVLVAIIINLFDYHIGCHSYLCCHDDCFMDVIALHQENMVATACGWTLGSSWWHRRGSIVGLW